MLRRNLLAGLAGLALGPAVLAVSRCTPAKAGLPIPHAELKRCWFIAKHAADARQMLERAPSSWGGLPWSFEGPFQFHDPERLETVRVRVTGVRDHFDASGRYILVEYAVIEPVRARKIGSRLFVKASAFDDTEADPE